jgi:hypothetical protein
VNAPTVEVPGDEETASANDTVEGTGDSPLNLSPMFRSVYSEGRSRSQMWRQLQDFNLMEHVIHSVASLSRAGREPSYRKTNQDNCFAYQQFLHPSQALFGAMDGHGPNGHKVCAAVLRMGCQHVDQLCWGLTSRLPAVWGHACACRFTLLCWALWPDAVLVDSMPRPPCSTGGLLRPTLTSMLVHLPPACVNLMHPSGSMLISTLRLLECCQHACRCQRSSRSSSPLSWPSSRRRRTTIYRRWPRPLSPHSRPSPTARWTASSAAAPP